MAQRNSDDQVWYGFLSEIEDLALKGMPAPWADDPADELGDRLTRFWLTSRGLPRNADDARKMTEFIMVAMVHAGAASALMHEHKG